MFNDMEFMGIKDCSIRGCFFWIRTKLLNNISTKFRDIFRVFIYYF